MSGEHSGGALGSPLRFEALLSTPVDKDISPNVVLMGRSFQESCGFKLGDQIRVVLANRDAPVVEEVVVKDVTGTENCPVMPDREMQMWEHVLGCYFGKLRLSTSIHGYTDEE